MNLNLSTLKNRVSRRIFLKLWILLHTLAAGLFIARIVTGGLNINASFLDMIPSETDSTAAHIAEENITASSQNNVFILSKSADFSIAKQNAQKVYDALKDDSRFNSVSLYADNESAQDVTEFLQKYRFMLLNQSTVEELNTPEGAQNFARNALAKVFGGFTLSSFDNIAADPFLLDEVNLQNCLRAITESGTAFGPKDGVLAREFKGDWYVMIRAELSEKGAKLGSHDNGVPLIYRTCLPLESEDAKMVFFGTPFHSYKSSSSASLEISIISTVSMIAVILILLFVFKSFVPLAASVLSIVLSVATAFALVHGFFGSIHLITLVFGTSLIGSCIDYSLHYFINWKASPALESGTQIRRHIFNGLFLSLVSTEICFVILFFAPFMLLKQIALFSFAGILSSFLTVMAVYPVFSLPPEEKRCIPLIQLIELNKSHFAKVRGAVKFIPLVLSLLSLLVLGFNYKKLAVRNDLSNLYKMEGRLREDTILAAQVIDYNPTNYLIVRGKTEQEVLEKEEALIPKIPDPFVCTARFIPSVKKQNQSYEAVKNLLPYAGEQFAALGFDESDCDSFINEFNSKSASFVTLSNDVPEFLKSLLKILWIGQSGDYFYSVILPSKISDPAVYEQLAASDQDVFYESKVSSISQSLDKLTVFILLMFACAFVVIAFVLRFFYDSKTVFKVVSVPLLALLCVGAVFVLSGLNIEFFGITGIILVFGLGLDYVIYRIENKNNTTESFAIFLSFLTTAISFGSLVLSAFVPVHVLGLSIFTGLVVSFICAML